MIILTIEGEPFGKLNLQPTIIGGRLTVYQPKKNENYINQVIAAISKFVKDNNVEPLLYPKGTPVKVSIDAFFGIPKQCFRKNGLNDKGQKMHQQSILPTKKPDCDNISKIICDGITHSAMIWHDDSQVCELEVHKWYSVYPRVEVCISSIVE